jgi:hypothetical protein
MIVACMKIRIEANKVDRLVLNIVYHAGTFKLAVYKSGTEFLNAV